MRGEAAHRSVGEIDQRDHPFPLGRRFEAFPQDRDGRFDEDIGNLKARNRSIGVEITLVGTDPPQRAVVPEVLG